MELQQWYVTICVATTVPLVMWYYIKVYKPKQEMRKSNSMKDRNLIRFRMDGNDRGTIKKKCRRLYLQQKSRQSKKLDRFSRRAKSWV